MVSGRKTTDNRVEDIFLSSPFVELESCSKRVRLKLWRTEIYTNISTKLEMGRQKLLKCDKITQFIFATNEGVSDSMS